MEINCGSAKLTTLQQSLLMCAVGETALAASLVKAHLAVSILAQEYMKLLTNHPKLRGDQHISCPCKPADTEVDDGDSDEDGEEDDAEEEEDGTPADGNKPGALKGTGGGAGRPQPNGEDEDEDDEEQGVGEEDPNDDDEDDDDEDEEEDDDEDEEEDEGEEEENEEEEEDEEEEALQPPKKRKK